MERGWLQSLVGDPLPEVAMVTGQFREGQCEREVGEQERVLQVRPCYCEWCAKPHLKGL